MRRFTKLFDIFTPNRRALYQCAEGNVRLLDYPEDGKLPDVIEEPEPIIDCGTCDEAGSVDESVGSKL